MRIRIPQKLYYKLMHNKKLNVYVDYWSKVNNGVFTFKSRYYLSIGGKKI